MSDEAPKLYDVIGMEGGTPDDLDELDVNYGAAAVRDRSTHRVRNAVLGVDSPDTWEEIVEDGCVHSFTPAGPVLELDSLFVITLRRETEVEKVFLKYAAGDQVELMWCDKTWRYFAMHWDGLRACARATAVELMVNIPKTYKNIEEKKRLKRTILILEYRLRETMNIYYDRKVVGD